MITFHKDATGMQQPMNTATALANTARSFLPKTKVPTKATPASTPPANTPKNVKKPSPDQSNGLDINNINGVWSYLSPNITNVNCNAAINNSNVDSFMFYAPTLLLLR